MREARRTELLCQRVIASPGAGAKCDANAYGKPRSAASCAPNVDEPNAAGPPALVVPASCEMLSDGLLNVSWLVRLYASTRKLIFHPSLTMKFLLSDMSSFQKCSPRMIPRYPTRPE